MAENTNTEAGSQDAYSPLLARLLKIDPTAMDSVSLSALGRAALGADTDEYRQAKEEVDSARAAMVKALENRRSGVDPAMLALSAGFLAPTRTGSFGESLSNAIRGYSEEDRRTQQDIAEMAKMRYDLARSTLQERGQEAKLGLDVVSKLTPTLTEIQKQVRAEGLDPSSPEGRARVREIQATKEATPDMKEFAARSGIPVSDPTFAAKYATHQRQKPLADIALRENLDLNDPAQLAQAQNLLRAEKLRTANPEIAKVLEEIGGDITNQEDVNRARATLQRRTARAENPAVVKILEEFGGDINNPADLARARTLLQQRSARSDSPEIAKIIEQQGGDINNPADVARARLQLQQQAARAQKPELAKVLETFGGDPLNPADVRKAEAILAERERVSRQQAQATLTQTQTSTERARQEIEESRREGARRESPEIYKILERTGGNANNPADVARARTILQQETARANFPELAKVLQTFGGDILNPADVGRAERILAEKEETSRSQSRANLEQTRTQIAKTRQEIAEHRRNLASGAAGAAGAGPVTSERDARAAQAGVPALPGNRYAGMTPREEIAARSKDKEAAEKYIEKNITPFVATIDTDITNLQRALELNSKISTGLTYGLPVIGEAAKALSGDRRLINEFDSLAALAAKQNRIPGDSNVSNLDVKMMSLGTFSSDKEPGANKTIIEYQLAQRERDRDLNSYLTNYAAVNGVIDSNAMAQWRRYLDANPITSRDRTGRMIINRNRMPYQEFFRAPRVQVDANGREQRGR